jgi:hypothetical protein
MKFLWHEALVVTGAARGLWASCGRIASLRFSAAGGNAACSPPSFALVGAVLHHFALHLPPARLYAILLSGRPQPARRAACPRSLRADPVALGTIMGRRAGAIDKAAAAYAPINKVLSPAGKRRCGMGRARRHARLPAQRPPRQQRDPRRGAPASCSVCFSTRAGPVGPPTPLQMCDPHGNPNLLTAPADEKWKAIRKGVAVSFAFQNIKKKFPMVVGRVNEVGSPSCQAPPSRSPAASFLERPDLALWGPMCQAGSCACAPEGGTPILTRHSALGPRPRPPTPPCSLSRAAQRWDLGPPSTSTRLRCA